MSSSQSTLSSFNPHAVHPFTAGTSQPSSHHHPARTPNPSSHTSQTQNIPTYNSTASSSQQPVYGSSTTSTSVQSPQPHIPFKHPTFSQAIFTPFRFESSSPELRDILVKKGNASAWPTKTNGTQGAKSGSNGKK